MNPERLGRLARTLRVRQRITQERLATRAGVARNTVSLLERGRVRELKLATAESILAALDARLELRVWWNGPELDRLLDADHAALGASVKRRLERWGWVVRVEASYSRYGERGRIDLLAWHPPTRTLLLVEIKTDLVDVQALLGSLDVKARLARGVAERFGWTGPRAVVPAIIFASDRTTRRRLARLDTLFDRYAVRGRRAVSWLRRPIDPASGLLWFVTLPPGRPRAHGMRVRAPARQRD